MGELLLLAPAVSAETIAALEELLVRARAGHIIGIAFVIMGPGYRYEVDIAGGVRNARTFARGMLLALDDELAKISQGNQ